jgi:hypothetical protein
VCPFYGAQEGWSRLPIAVIRYFICHDNLTRAAALLV